MRGEGGSNVGNYFTLKRVSSYSNRKHYQPPENNFGNYFEGGLAKVGEMSQNLVRSWAQERLTAWQGTWDRLATSRHSPCWTVAPCRTCFQLGGFTGFPGGFCLENCGRHFIGRRVDVGQNCNKTRKPCAPGQFVWD